MKSGNGPQCLTSVGVLCAHMKHIFVGWAGLSGPLHGKAVGTGRGGAGQGGHSLD